VIDASWAKKALPAPGMILVVRDEVSARFLSLFLPESYQTHTRKATATVLAVHPDCDPAIRCTIRPGDRVLLAPSAGRKVKFGFTPSEEIELWSVYPRSVLAKLLAADNADYAPGHEGDATAWVRSRGPEIEDRFEEGDLRGLR
jgi:hypothetical protein